MTALTAAITERDLIERVENASGSNRRLDEDLWWALCPVSARHTHRTNKRPWVPEFTSSLDVVVTIIERELPDKQWEVHRNRDGGYIAEIWNEAFAGKGTNPALALLLAFLRARQAAASAGAA